MIGQGRCGFVVVTEDAGSGTWRGSGGGLEAERT